MTQQDNGAAFQPGLISQVDIAAAMFPYPLPVEKRTCAGLRPCYLVSASCVDGTLFTQSVLLHLRDFTHPVVLDRPPLTSRPRYPHVLEMAHVNIRTSCLHIVIVMGVVCAFCAPPTPAAACSPAPGYQPPTIAARTIAATVVLVGKVITTTTPAFPGPYAATVEVQQAIKGVEHVRGRSVVTIDGFGPSSLCLNEVAVGQTWLFFATVDAMGQLHAQYIDAYAATAPADAAGIAEAEAAARVGQRLWLPIVSTGAAWSR